MISKDLSDFALNTYYHVHVASTNTYNVRQESWSRNLGSWVGNFGVSCCKCGVTGSFPTVQNV